METASYALREDQSTIVLLQDAGNHYEKFCQIATFARNIVRPAFFNECLYFSPFIGYNGKYKGDATDVKISIEDNGYDTQYDYVAVIDSEIEFKVTHAVVRKLAKEHMPAWGAKAYLDYFNERKSGFLLLLRVYKVDRALPADYLRKGRQGSAQILRLYDKDGSETSVSFTRLGPVISDNKFSYIKDEILHLLKVNGAFIAIYDNSEQSLAKLENRVEAERLLRGTGKGSEEYLSWMENPDEEDDFDMAQLDYEAIFNQVIEEYPGMEPVVEYAKGIQAARVGEYDYYLQEVHNHSDNEEAAIARIFDMSLRQAIRNAMNFSKKGHIDFEDAFQEACIGLLKAIQKHTDNVEGLFPSYASTWEMQVVDRSIPRYQDNVRVPIHYVHKIDEAIKSLGLCGEELEGLDFNELYNVLLNNTDCDSNEAFKMAYIMTPPVEIDAIIESPDEETLAVEEVGYEKVIERSIEQLIHDAVDTLISSRKKVINYRFGLDGNSPLSLEEAGQKLKITRERVRQIESTGLLKIAKYLLRKKVVTQEQFDKVVEIDSDGKAKFKPKARRKG